MSLRSCIGGWRSLGGHMGRRVLRLRCQSRKRGEVLVMSCGSA